jgi:hypothetical protein
MSGSPNGWIEALYQVSIPSTKLYKTNNFISERKEKEQTSQTYHHRVQLLIKIKHLKTLEFFQGFLF